MIGIDEPQDFLIFWIISHIIDRSALDSIQLAGGVQNANGESALLTF